MNPHSNNFSSVLRNQSSDYSAYSDRHVIFENFDNHGYKVPNTLNGNTIITGEINPLTGISSDYSTKLQIVNTNYIDLSNNIAKITNDDGTGIRDYLKANSDKYDFSGNYIVEKPKTLLDGLVYDNQLLTVQENAMYVLGTITAASLIVFAIAIGKE